MTVLQTIRDLNLINTTIAFTSGGLINMYKADRFVASFNKVHNALVREVRSGFDATGREAIKQAAQALSMGMDAGLSESALQASVLGAMDTVFAPLPAELSEEILNAVVYITHIARNGITQPLALASHFNLVDVETVTKIRDNGKFWIGDVYTKQVRGTINETMTGIIGQGLGRDEATQALQTAFSGTLELSKERAGIVASASATTGRSLSQITTFEALQITTVEFWNPLDERTSWICEELTGMEFETSTIIPIRDAYLSAQSPDDVKESWRWPTRSDVNELRTAPGVTPDPRDLANSGIAVPPLHGHCRSSLIVSSDITRSLEKILDGNTEADYYSVNIAGAVDIWDVAKTEARSPELRAIPVGFFGEIIYNENLKDKTVTAIEKNEPILPVLVQMRRSDYIILDNPHLVAASKEIGLLEVPCILVDA